MSGREPRRSLTSDRRGQTLPDYVAGISVFFITIAAILGLMPSFVTPYQSDVAGQDTAQAERIAQQLVANLSAANEPNHVNLTELQNVLSHSQTDLANRFGVQEYKRINITVSQLDGSAFATAGGSNLTSQTSYNGQSAATGVRIVRFTGGGATCDPACRLLVRVW